MSTKSPRDFQLNVDREINKPTAQDIRRHKAALHKIKAKLFNRYDLEAYGFKENLISEISPMVSFTVSSLGVDRYVSLGGIRAQVNYAENTSLELTIEHTEKDNFKVCVFVHNGDQSYVRLSTHTQYRKLDDHVLKCVTMASRELSKVKHSRQKTPLPTLLLKQ